ncbi:MAG: PKD domain-containing protein [Candidatus Thermoplasmatota archaeon]
MQNGSLTSEEIILPNGMLWSALNITKTEPSPENNITVSILNGSTGIPLPAYADMPGADIDISGINATLYPSIKLLANFSGNRSATPLLHEWRVTWTWDGKTPLINHTAVTSAPVGSAINITVNVSDPGGVSAVTLCYKDVGAGSYTSVPMALISGDNTKGDWSAEIPPQWAVGTAYYYINATDGIYNSSHPAEDAYLNPHAIAIYDGTAPEITHTPPSVVNTSEAVEIVAAVTDNVAVFAVNIFYYFDTPGGFTPAQYKSMNDQGGGNYNYTISVPDNALSLHYDISAKDAANNWNETGIVSKGVVDNDDPEIGIGAMGTPCTGENFTITAAVADNIGVSEVRLVYYLETSTGQTSTSNVTMGTSTDGMYQRTINLPRNALVLYYELSARDGSSNWNQTDMRSLSVHDIECPEVTDLMSGTPTTGENFTISALVSDNIWVGAVYLVYWIGADNPTNMTLGTTTGSLFMGEISVPHRLEPFHYRLAAVDEGGNWWVSEPQELEIRDNDPPSAVALVDERAVTGTKVTFDASSSNDNIGIVNYTWVFEYGGLEIELYGAVQQFEFRRAGAYEITLNVSDAAGNWDTDTAVLVVAAEGDDMWGGWLSELWWLLLLTIIVLIALLALGAHRSRKRRPMDDALSYPQPYMGIPPSHPPQHIPAPPAPEVQAPEPPSATEPPREPEAPTIPQSTPSDEYSMEVDKLSLIEQRYREGKISKDTYEMLKRRYSG